MRLVKILVLFVYCCQTISANSSNSQNATIYRFVKDQFDNFDKHLITTNFSVLGINNICALQLEAFTYALNPQNRDIQLWAAKMFDAIGKLEPGILEGNFYSLGSYDECLSIRDEMVLHEKEMFTISGKYCLAQLGNPTTENFTMGQIGSGVISLGICMPSACSAKDLNKLSEVIHLPLRYNDAICQVHDEVVLSAGDIAVIVFLSLVGLITIMSTCFDIYCQKINDKSKASNIFLSFSLLTNGRKLFATSTNSDQLQCLSGIRAISMMWIILSHMFSYTSMIRPLSNLAYMRDFYEDGWTMYIRGGTVSVDSFFLLSGILLMYVYLNILKTQKVNFNIFFYYLHRYIRLTPAMAVVILIHITLLRHFGSGPMWPNVETFLMNQCKINWWVDLLYLQNYINTPDMCVGQTWYLAVDTQLFLLSPLILIPLRRWRKETIGMVVVATCASMASTFAFAWTMELHVTNSKLGTVTAKMSSEYVKYYYTATYNRASSWLIGILAGYCIYNAKVEKKSFKINPIHNIILWICALSVLLTCVFYDTAKDNYDQTAVSFYIAFLKPAWCIALAWVVFSCVTGHGGVVDWFLSLPLFQVLARLTYSMYLVHMSIIIASYLAEKNSIVVSNVTLMYEFWSMYALCLGVGIILTLLFESPIIALEKSLKNKSKNTQ